MISNYTNQLNASFRLYLDHILCNAGGYTNISGFLYPTSDPNYSQYTVAGSPFRQWVADSSISGAKICTTVNDVGNGIWNETSLYWNTNPDLWNGNTGTLTVDFERGRIITDYQLNQPISCQYAKKDWNIYFNYLDEPSLLLDTSFELQSPIPQVTGALNWQSQPYPCIYIQNKYQENVPYAFGGTDTSETNLSLILLTNNSFNLDSTMSLLANQQDKYFPTFTVSDLPFDVLGGLKTGYYSYSSLCSQQPENNFVHINRVKVSKFNSALNKQLSRGVRGAFVDIECSLARNPRNY